MKELNKIFIVDDDPTCVYLIKRTIKSTNLPTQIEEFADGLEAIDHLKEIVNQPLLLPDIILLDLSMPVLDGWAFIQEYAVLLPEIKKDIPVFIVSSTISPIDIERAKQNSIISDLFIKPLSKEKVIELLTNLE